MVRIFGKKRLGLINGKRLRKYLLYAIGEILLVVIGILLALYINNKNQEVKVEKKMEILLDEVINDLSLFIKMSKNQLDFYSNKKEILLLIINKQLTYEDYVNNKYPNMTTATTWYSGGSRRKIAYNNLIHEINSVPAKYSSIVNQLGSFYDNPFNEKYIELIENISIENERKLVDNYSWYSYFDREKENVEKINYLLNDPLYKNEVVYYYQLVNHHCGFILKDLLLAQNIFEKIHEIKDIPIDSSLINVEFDDQEELMGKWISPEFVDSYIEVILVDKVITYRTSRDTTGYPLYPISSSKLIDDDTTFWKLEKSDSTSTLKISTATYIKAN